MDIDDAEDPYNLSNLDKDNGMMYLIFLNVYMVMKPNGISTESQLPKKTPRRVGIKEASTSQMELPAQRFIFVISTA